MKLRLISNISIGLLLSCNTFFISSAQAEDNVKTSQVTADVNNSSLQISQVKVNTQYKAADGSIINRPLIQLVPDQPFAAPTQDADPGGVHHSSLTLGKEMVQIGGAYDSNNQPVPMALSLIGRPYGNYNAGCTLCVFSTQDGMFGGGAQAALSGLDYHGGNGYTSADAVANGDMAAAGFYQYDENSSGRVVAQASSFGAGVVTLASPMSTEEMSQLHEGMYVATNVLESPPDLNTVDNQKLINPKVYWGYIKSWDATHINVYAWQVPGSGNCPLSHTDGSQPCDSNKLPDIKNLDAQLSTYKVPMVFVGVPKKVFSKNTFVHMDGSKVLGDHATSIANEYEREEFDFRAKNWKKPHSLSFHGWTTSFQCGGQPEDECHPNAVSEDSYAYLVNGPNGLPRAYIAQMGGDALEFSGYSTFIGGSGSPLQVDDQGNTSIGGQGSNHIMSSFASTLPSKNTVYMSTIINRDVTTTNDWRDYSVRLVMNIDGNRDRVKGFSGGSPKGSIAFNYNNKHDGGICLLGNDTNQGLCQEMDGSVNFAKGVTLNNDTFVAPGKFIFFKNSTKSNAVYMLLGGDTYTDADKAAGKEDTRGDLFIGTQVAGGGNIRGVNGYYGKSLTLTGNANLNGGTVINGTTTFNQPAYIAPGKGLFFKNNDNSNAVYLLLDNGTYTDADKAAGKEDTRGDIYIGTQVAGGANIRGVNGYYGKSLTVTNTVSAPKFHGQLSTPSSSLESCNAGDFKDDANYHYVCVATNKWKRVTLSDF